MSAENFLKITYHGGPNKNVKINAYLKMPSPTYMFLLREIENCIFQQHKQPVTELRTYWIDEDNDEIEIVNQCDYEIFTNKRSERRHLQVAPASAADSSNNADPNDSLPKSSSAVHPNVSCDGCSKQPVVGFRYKCIQCPNYDLCESCEGQHKHADHMMVRMPNITCPSVIEAWISGSGSGRRHKRASSASTCPFVQASANCSASATSRAGDDANAKSNPNGGKEHNHHARHTRKHHRRQMQNGIFTHLYNMMQDLAEGGGPTFDEETENVTTTTNEGQRSSDVNSEKNGTANDETRASASENLTSTLHEAAHAAAHAAASKAALVAAASAAHAAKVAAEAVVAGAGNPNTATTPKTPPPTPNNGGEPDFTKSNQPTTKNLGNNEATSTPVNGSPILENVAQFVDPQYMKAGIQILNNFSEMFAKILDPVENSAGGGVPPFLQNVRRNSSSSFPTSLNGSTISTNDTQKAAEEQKEATPIVLNLSGSATNETSSSSDRSHSEETDWQIIEKQPSLNIGPSTENAVSVSDDVAGVAGVQTQTTEINYAQLGRDLQAHMQEEQKKDQANKTAAAANAATSTAVSIYAATGTTSINTATTAASTNAVTSTASNATIAADASTNTVAANVLDPAAANAAYHWDNRIDKAVKGMMAMGFSNEGNWLTQLLESVDGDIPKAVDLLSSAQRGS